jgi:hypothetical protein
MIKRSLLWQAKKQKLTLGRWVLTRPPLVLSDTAMVLLRRSVEATEYGRSIQSSHHWQIEREIQQELMHEIWLLWTFPDLLPKRHLDWHIIFDTTLMMMAEMMLISPYEYSRGNRRFMSGYDTKCFIEKLEAAYRSGLISYIQTKTTP